MNVNRLEALDMLRAFDGLRRRLDALGTSPSMEQLRIIDELAHAYGGQVLSKNTSMESTIHYAYDVDRRVNSVIASLEGLFSFFKKKEPEKQAGAANNKDNFYDLERYIKEAKQRTPNEKPVHIDGYSGGALLPAKGDAVTDPKKLYDLLKKDYDVLSRAAKEFKTKLGEWYKWADDSENKIWAVVQEDGKKWTVAEEFDEAELIRVVKSINSSRKRRPIETIDVPSKLVLKTVINMGRGDSSTPKHETGTVRIEPLTDKSLIVKLADLADSYAKIEEEIQIYLEEISDEYSLSGGDDQPYRYPPVSDAIDEAIGLQHLDWEAHNGYFVQQLGEDIGFAAFQKYSGIAKWLDRALNEK